ncbi:3-dehydroquinate synthase [Desulfocucumis palustris]|uniref:3-dehydroquinate synthase n=1 Tax=Desulfocucumis palustris TaxID=1898651 RepID=A0A2L2XDV1_9FIRM|nr:3-dehydroquinate synthase [Desulfocucumis palustris]GBF34204.1 3-dehydroquinate synthase [Desulfocucumis palustris]
MSEITVGLGDRSYNIFIRPGCLNSLCDGLKKFNFSRRLLLVSNPTVYGLYGGALFKSLVGAGFEVVVGEVPDGEEHKSLFQAERLYDLAFSRELDRRSPVLALGGGVIGDLAGFVAATYLRGVPFVQIPTTLLAQVDSSVGGKVAVNHPAGKNIIGAFYQPVAVFTDLNTLLTLDPREIRSGLAEVIKYGVIADDGFFTWLEDNIERVLGLEAGAMEYVVEKSCRIKALVVQSDETEQGLRAILNFGHTIGHAVEALTEYKTYRHGEAVSLGMALAAELAANIGMLEQSTAERIEKLLVRAGLPVKLPLNMDRERIIDLLRRDKKVISGALTFVLPTGIGRVEIVRDVSGKDIAGALKG